MWKDKGDRTEKAAGRGGTGFTKERIYTTYDEAVAAGEEPLYNDPFFNVVQEKYLRGKSIRR